jgi:hypothetical protein
MQLELYIAEKTMTHRVAELHAEAAGQYLVRSLDRSQMSWLSRRASALACEAGLLMVRLGVWLENQGMAQPSSQEGRG